MGHQQRERTRKRGLRDVLIRSPEVQRFLASQTPKPTLRMALAVGARRWWPWFFGLALAFAMAAAATLKHWGA